MSASPTGVFSQNNKPLAGQTIVIGDTTGAARSTQTDQFGDYRFTDLTPGVEYLIVFAHPDVSSDRVTPSEGYRFRLERGGSSFGNDFVITPKSTDPPPSLTEAVDNIDPAILHNWRNAKEVVVDGRSVKPSSLPPGKHTIHYVDESGVIRMREVTVSR